MVRKEDREISKKILIFLVEREEGQECAGGIKWINVLECSE